MGALPPADDPLEVEELGWVRAHRRAIAIGTAIAAVVLAVAVAVDPGGEPDAAPATSTTPGPTTTEPRPVTTRLDFDMTSESPSADADSSDPDWRMVLREVPDDYELTVVQASGPMEAARRPMQLLVGEGATWDTGPWVLVTSSPRDQVGGDGLSLFYDWPLRRPPASVTVGGWEGLTGKAYTGIDLLALRDDATEAIVLYRGVDLATVSDLVGAATIEGTTIVLPSAGMPGGLAPLTDEDLTFWLSGWSPDVASYLEIRRPDGSGLISIVGMPPAPGRSSSGVAGFFLGDLHYVTIGGEPGVAGTFANSTTGPPVLMVRWRHDGRQLVASSSAGLTLPELIDVASDVITSGDPDWSVDAWRAARHQESLCCQAEQPPRELSYGIDAFAAPADAHWSLDLRVGDSSVDWWFRGRGSFGGTTPRSAPALDVTSTYGYAFLTDAYHAGATAILDRAQVGSVLRLTTTGTAPQTIEVPLQPVRQSDLLEPFIVAGAVLPWSDGGFVAELVAPDGTTILTQTDADLG